MSGLSPLLESYGQLGGHRELQWAPKGRQSHGYSFLPQKQDREENVPISGIGQGHVRLEKAGEVRLDLLYGDDFIRSNFQISQVLWIQLIDDWKCTCVFPQKLDKTTLTQKADNLIRAFAND